MTAPPESGPSAEDIVTLASVAGVPVTPEVAARIAASIGPGLRGFAAVAGSLPFDLEPANFTVIQNGLRL